MINDDPDLHLNLIEAIHTEAISYLFDVYRIHLLLALITR